MADKKDLLRALLEALQEKADDSDDADTKQLFREVRDELRRLNEGMGNAQAQRQEEEHAELAKHYPALKSKPPRPKVST